MTMGLCLAEPAAREPLRATPGRRSAGLTMTAGGASAFGIGELISVLALALLALDLLLNNPHMRGFVFGARSSSEGACGSVGTELDEMTLASCGCHPVPAGACVGLPRAIPMAMTPVSPWVPMVSWDQLGGGYFGDGSLPRLGTWKAWYRCLSAFKVR